MTRCNLAALPPELRDHILDLCSIADYGRVYRVNAAHSQLISDYYTRKLRLALSIYMDDSRYFLKTREETNSCIIGSFVQHFAFGIPASDPVLNITSPRGTAETWKQYARTHSWVSYPCEDLDVFSEYCEAVYSWGSVRSLISFKYQSPHSFTTAGSNSTAGIK